MDKLVILLVEDTELFLQIEHSFLQRERFEVHMARTGKEALEKSLELRPHLIMLSLMMPDMDGDQICAILKKNPLLYHAKVVIASANHDEATLTRCVDAGCDGILTKPFQRDQLLETVQRLLNEAQRRKPRYRVELPCAVHIERESIPGSIVDISEIGCRLYTEDSIETSAGLEVGFDLPDTVHSVQWRGIVRWSREPEKPGGVHSAGIEFLDTPLEEQQILQEILTALPPDRRV